MVRLRRTMFGCCRSAGQRPWISGGALAAVAPGRSGACRRPRAFAHPLAYSQGFDLLVNIAIFAPLGASLRWVGVGFRRSVALGACLSTVIEIVQLGIPGRFTSTDDLILNTVGAAVGYLAGAWAVSRAAEARAPVPRRTRRS